MVDSMSVRLENARVEKKPLNICTQWNAETACVSECVLKKLTCRGLRVGRSKLGCLPPALQLNRSQCRKRHPGRSLLCCKARERNSGEIFR